jgi:hypothetical protein
MKSLQVLLLAAFLVLVLAAPASFAQEDTTCLVYFTATGCPNCAFTDPIVLAEWTATHGDLVVIEYMFSGWSDPNALLLGQYAQNYNTMSAVPKLFVSGTDISSGRLEVPAVGDRIGGLSGNKCVLLEGSASFGELNLSGIPGSLLKLWSNGRLLVREAPGDVDSQFLREILFSENLEGALSNSMYDIHETEPEPAPISGGSIEFENSVRIGDSWVLSFSDNITLPEHNQSGQNTTGNIIDIPLFGSIDMTQTSLPLLTVIIGLADGFNPCAFFILSFLLGALVYAMSRKRILIVGGIFVFFSGFVYFLFMSAWLNVFLLGAEIVLLTIFAGLVAVVAGLINIKDFFFFKKGISLTLPKKDKLKFMQRVDRLLKGAESLPALIAGTAVIAATVNLYELLCTVGFPMVYTRILTLQNIPAVEYYVYLIFYNIMYVVPVAVIVLAFALTLGSIKFTEEGVRNLKLVSGVIILLFGLNLLLNPEALENVGVMFLIIAGSLAVSVPFIIAKKLHKSRKRNK